MNDAIDGGAVSASSQTDATRRSLGAWMTALALTPSALAIAAEANAQTRGRSDEDLTHDEDYWASIARAFNLDGRYIVLNGGGNNPLPVTVVNALNRFDQMAASQPRPHNSGFVARTDDMRERLAPYFGCGADELALTRNTTEGLNIVCWGLDLAPGDEIVFSNFDNHYAGQVLRHRAQRHGVVLRQVDVPLAPSQAQVIEAFTAAMTAKTKLVVASHLVDGWGFVLPIRGLSDLAHRNGALMLADGALSFGHIPINVRQLGCDFYATSLHKWLTAPLGTGALYVRKDNIGSVWPLYGVDTPADDIRKFEQIGTRSGPTIAAIGHAIDFYEQIGPARKLARMKYLLNHAIGLLSGTPRVRVITERDPGLRTGLARVSVEGMSGAALMNGLRDGFDIYTFGGFSDAPDGVYICPNVFNSRAQIDRFAAAIIAIAST
ncbi:MAG: aminotransferase class V-fold PLP-dependent enzyme [Terricaulis sp.]